MIWVEKQLKSTEISEIIAYLCGAKNSTLKTITGALKDSNDWVELDNCGIETELHNTNFERLHIHLENGMAFEIEIDHMSPGIVHYICNNFFEEGEGFISGGV